MERTLDLLTALRDAGRPLGLSELARVAGMPVTTVLRLLSVLERRGFVEKDRGRYHLGAAIVSLAQAFMSGNTLARAALPVLEQLTLLSGETASLYVRQGFERVVAQRVNSPHPLRYSLRVGERRPLHLGSGGLVLAAAMPEQELNQMLDRIGEVRLATGRTLSREEFLAKLERVRRQGFAISLEEREIGVASVAAPILRPGQPAVAVVGVTGPLSRLTGEKMEVLSVELRRSAGEIAVAWSRA